MSKFTPGPWSYGEQTGYRVKDSDNRTICFTEPYHWRPSEECSANARLIAAAPELLEALSLFLKYDTSGSHTCGPNSSFIGWQDGAIGRDAIAKARAAIRKAEGSK